METNHIEMYLDELLELRLTDVTKDLAERKCKEGIKS